MRRCKRESRSTSGSWRWKQPGNGALPPPTTPLPVNGPCGSRSRDPIPRFIQRNQRSGPLPQPRLSCRRHCSKPACNPNSRFMRFSILLFSVAAVLRAAEFPAPVVDVSPSGKTQTAVLAGGCFWGVEAVFEQLKGVSEVVAGFAGGSKLTAHYEVVGFGMTGHAESVKITFDPAQISYGKLL